MDEPEQEVVNEDSYSSLLLGNEVQKPKDPTKDSRWHAVRGIGYSINIAKGELEKIKIIVKNPERLDKIIAIYNEEFTKMYDTKERLKDEIHSEKNLGK